jgi:spore germination protein KB
MTALPGSDFHFVVFLYGASAVVLVYLGIEAICRATYLILPFALAGVLLVFAGLAPVLKPLYIFPWQGFGLAALLQPTLFLTGANAPVTLLVLMAPVFQNVKTLQTSLIFGFGGSTVLRSLANVIYVMTFGTVVAAEKPLPFFEMARLIYINKYVQRLEAIFIILWVIAGVLGIAVSLYGSLYIIARLFKLPSISPLLLPLGLIMTQVASMLPDAAAVVIVASTVFTVIIGPGVIAVTLALLAAALLKGGDKPCGSD